MLVRLIQPFPKALLLGACIVFAVVSTIGFSACTPQCDYPEVRVAKLRLVNAMPDQDNITVWLNGRKFWADYPYTIGIDFPFGYYDHYADGTPLAIGGTIVVVTADAAGRDTIMVDSVNFNVNRQTLVVMGRAHAAPSEPNTKKVLLLDDQTRLPDPDLTLVRFIHAIPDLPKLDIRWHTRTDGKPDASIAYGESNGYSDVRMVKIDNAHQDSLIVTESGHPENVIALIPYTFTSNGFFLTVIIRGRTKPVGTEHSASTFALTDAQGGTIVVDFSTFGARIMNASRSVPKLSLLVKAPADSINNYDPRNNYPQQDRTVLDIPTDSLSQYLALNPGLNGYSHYYFCTAKSYSSAAVMGQCEVGGASADDRYTFVAVETAKLGQPTTSLDPLVLTDTMTLPANRAFNRIRVIMVSPDHTSIVASFGGQQQPLSFKAVAYFDVAVGGATLLLSDGAATRSIPVTVVPNRPMSVYLLPAQSGAPFPVKIVTE